MYSEKCLVVGLGKIGMGFDFDLDCSDYILTHCSAIQMHNNFSLIGGVDPSHLKRSAFEARFSAPAFHDVDDALSHLNPTVGIICNPTEFHLAVVAQMVQSPGLKVILCEKPLSYDYEQAQGIVDLCRENNVQLYVNYMRRADPNVKEIKRRIDQEEVLAPIKINAWYSKGIFNNGSHLINLVSYWLGDYVEHVTLSRNRLWNNSDPEPDVFIRFKKGTMTLMSVWEESYTHLTLEMLSPSGRLYYSNGGEDISFYHVASDKLFEGYRVLSEQPEIFDNFFLKYQLSVYDEVSRAINGEHAYLSSGVDALNTLSLVSKLVGDNK